VVVVAERARRHLVKAAADQVVTLKERLPLRLVAHSLSQLVRRARLKATVAIQQFHRLSLSHMVVPVLQRPQPVLLAHLVQVRH
jgi:hypothetical protein